MLPEIPDCVENFSNPTKSKNKNQDKKKWTEKTKNKTEKNRTVKNKNLDRKKNRTEKIIKRTKIIKSMTENKN